MTRRNPDRTRELLLSAARREALEIGSTLSLASVAERAGVSKGGLLHHFPTKDALLLALTLEIIDEFRARVEEARELEAATSGPAPGAWLRAYIEVSFAMAEDFAALYAACGALESNELDRQAVVAAQRFIIERAEDDGVPPARAHVVRCACDGVLLARRAWLPELDEAARQQMKAEMLSWTHP